MTAAPVSPLRLRARAIAGALAVLLSFEAGSAHAAPSERDLAYEQGVQAEEAGDHARAAAEYARAYRLTAPAEAGPRLLFLRASVAARLRAGGGEAEAREQLCQARSLLREHLAAAPPPAGPDPLAEERVSLARVEQDLRDTDCGALDPAAQPPVPGDSSSAPTAPTNATGSPVPQDSSGEPAGRAPSPAAQPPVPAASSAPNPLPPVDSRSPRLIRGLRIAGFTSLGVSVASFATMGVGIALARDATRDGRAACWSAVEACDGKDLLAIVDDGNRANQIVKATATIGGLAFFATIVFLSLAQTRNRPPPPVAPRLGPGALGFGLQGRF